MYRSLLARDARDLFAELDRLQSTLFGASPQIRGGRGGYPPLNVGSTERSVEVYAFVPGLDPQALEINLERGVLTIDGERKPLVNGNGNGGNAGTTEKATLHLNERFAGRFRRVVSLPEDIDPEAVSASYRDGVLRVSIARREASRARRIAVN